MRHQYNQILLVCLFASQTAFEIKLPLLLHNHKQYQGSPTNIYFCEDFRGLVTKTSVGMSSLKEAEKMSNNASSAETLSSNLISSVSEFAPDELPLQL